MRRGAPPRRGSLNQVTAGSCGAGARTLYKTLYHICPPTGHLRRVAVGARERIYYVMAFSGARKIENPTPPRAPPWRPPDTRAQSRRAAAGAVAGSRLATRLQLLPSWPAGPFGARPHCRRSKELWREARRTQLLPAGQAQRERVTWPKRILEPATTN